MERERHVHCMYANFFFYIGKRGWEGQVCVTCHCIREMCKMIKFVPAAYFYCKFV